MAILSTIKAWIFGYPLVPKDRAIEIVAAAIQASDANGDGMISLNELIAAIKRAGSKLLRSEEAAA